MSVGRNLWLWVWGIASLVLYLLIGYATDRSNAVQVIASWLLLFGGYFFIASEEHTGKQLRWLIAIAILFRLSFLFAVPALSDDFYRFIWDGSLIREGINPYLYLPSSIISFNEELYAQLNSPNYYSVYPPVMQAVFWLSAALIPDNMLASVITMRLVIIASEVGTIALLYKLLKKYNLPISNVLWYALNPLLIIEMTGNLHFEAVMIFFLILAFYLLSLKKWWLAAVPFALSVVTKLVPLILLPLLWRYLGTKRFLLFTVTMVIVCGVTFTPFVNSNFIEHISDSVELYFQHFEFNASIYYLVRAAGYWIKGYNIIDIAGKVLPLIFLVMAVLYAVYYKKRDILSLANAALFTFFIYYLLALVVHPWYISILVVFAVFGRYKFPYVWACLAGLTYITYVQTPYNENLWLVALEYIVMVVYAVTELNRPHLNKSI